MSAPLRTRAALITRHPVRRADLGAERRALVAVQLDHRQARPRRRRAATSLAASGSTNTPDDLGARGRSGGGDARPPGRAGSAAASRGHRIIPTAQAPASTAASASLERGVIAAELDR